MNALFILIALTFSNGQMYDQEVTGQVWESYEDCIAEYKHYSKSQNSNTKFVCMSYDDKEHRLDQR